MPCSFSLSIVSHTKIGYISSLHFFESEISGGDGSAPEPFQLFLASIATCAGIYALSFCQSRQINTDTMSLTMECEWDEEKKRYEKFSIDLKLPEDF